MVPAETTQIDEPGPKSRPRKIFVPYLEGLRGVTAVYVAIYHVWFYTLTRPHVYAGSPLWIRLGHFGVGVFIVISGYVLTLPLLEGEAFHVKAFFRRRARRLLPAYYVALGLSVPLWILQLRLAGKPVAIKAILGDLIVHAAMLQDVSYKLAGSINGALWTVALEVQIYIVFALVLVPVTRRFGLLTMLAVAFVLGMAPVAAGFVPHHGAHYILARACPWFLVLFSLGSAAALVAHDSRYQRLVNVVPWGVLSAFCAVVAALVLSRLVGPDFEPNEDVFYWGDITVGLTAATAFVSFARAEAMHKFSPIVRLLDSRPFLAVGSFSYSIYLVHLPLIFVVVPLLDLRIHSDLLFMLAAYAVIPGVIAVAYLFYLAFERPFLSNFRRIEDELSIRKN